MHRISPALHLNAKTFSFTTALDTSPPSVTTVSPADGATDVALNGTVSATFDQPMDPATINTGTFTLSGTGGAVAGMVTYDAVNKTASFSPSSSLSYSTLYTASITTGATSLGGTAVTSQKTWTFTTTSAPDTTAPVISFTNPTSSATGVSINGSVSATFSEAMNGATFDVSSFTLSNGSDVVPGGVNYDNATHVATFTPSSALSYLTSYTATIGTGVTDLVGNNLASQYSWSFVTEPPPDTTPPTVNSTFPANGATGVSVSPSLIVTFSEAMSPDTINSSSITVNGVSGVVTYNTTDNTATFTPSRRLRMKPLILRPSALM